MMMSLVLILGFVSERQHVYDNQRRKPPVEIETICRWHHKCVEADSRKQEGRRQTVLGIYKWRVRACPGWNIKIAYTNMLDCNSKLDCFSGILPSARRMFSTVCCGILRQSNFTRFFRVGYRRALLWCQFAKRKTEGFPDVPSQLEASDSQSQDLLKPVSDANKAAFEAGSIAGCCRGWNCFSLLTTRSGTCFMFIPIPSFS